MRSRGPTTWSLSTYVWLIGAVIAGVSVAVFLGASEQCVSAAYGVLKVGVIVAVAAMALWGFVTRFGNDGRRPDGQSIRLRNYRTKRRARNRERGASRSRNRKKK